MGTEIVFEKLTSPLKTYCSDDVAGIEFDGKEECRRQVIDFILDNHAPMSMRFLGFPGVRWAAERMLDAEFSGPRYFVGVEREIGVVRKGMGWMPGTRATWFTRNLKPIRVDGVSTDRAAILNMEMRDFCLVRNSDLFQGHEQMRRQFTAIWLDFTCMLCQDMVFILPRLSMLCRFEEDRIPIAITFMKGREDPATTRRMWGSDRADYAGQLLSGNPLREFVDSHVHEYSSREVPMITLMGILRRR